jgi:hypothetical protein
MLMIDPWKIKATIEDIDYGGGHGGGVDIQAHSGAADLGNVDKHTLKRERDETDGPPQ